MGNLRSRRARRVLRRAGEAYRPQNINRKFAQGATVMFWCAICYGKSVCTSLIIIKFDIIFIFIFIFIIIIRILEFLLVLIYNVYKANNINNYN